MSSADFAQDLEEQLLERDPALSDHEEDDAVEVEDDAPADPGGKVPSQWGGSDVSSSEIEWLYASRRIPTEVSCRLSDGETIPQPEPGEVVVFMSHFERGFRLPTSEFFRDFLNYYSLQPHHFRPTPFFPCPSSPLFARRISASGP